MEDDNSYNNFCSDYDIPKRIFKCCSIRDKEVFVFLNIYFLENVFTKGDRVTWLIKNERLYGSVISVDSNRVKIKPDNKKNLSTINTEKLNIIHPFDKTISKISENISKKNKNLFEKIDEEQVKLLKRFIGGDEDVDIIDELFPLRKKGFKHNFIYNEMIYDDDTCITALKKISHICSSIDFEDHRFIYAAYLNHSNETIPLGFNYKDSEVLHPHDLLEKELCDILDNGEREESFNIIKKNYEYLLEENEIKRKIKLTDRVCEKISLIR